MGILRARHALGYYWPPKRVLSAPGRPFDVLALHMAQVSRTNSDTTTGFASRASVTSLDLLSSPYIKALGYYQPPSGSSGILSPREYKPLGIISARHALGYSQRPTRSWGINGSPHHHRPHPTPLRGNICWASSRGCLVSRVLIEPPAYAFEEVGTHSPVLS